MALAEGADSGDLAAGGETGAPGGAGTADETQKTPAAGNAAADPPTVARCSFCNRSAAEVWLLVEGPAGAHICDNCLAFCLVTVTGHTGGAVRFGAEDANGVRSVSGVELPEGRWETVRRCPQCGTYTLSPRDEGPTACAHCGLHFPDVNVQT